MKLNLDNIKSIIYITAAVVSCLTIVHSHAANEVEEVRQEINDYKDMSTAEFKLFTTNQELKWISLKPDDQLSDYELDQKEWLLDEKEHWTNRVRDIEAEK